MKTFQKNLLAFSVSVAAAGFGSQALAATTTLVSICLLYTSIHFAKPATVPIVAIPTTRSTRSTL